MEKIGTKNLLSEAYGKKDWEEVKRIIEKYGIENIDSALVLNCSCVHGHLEIVKFLIEKGVKIENKYVYCYKPLHHACCHGHLQIVKFLVEKGAGYQDRDIEMGRTPFKEALLNGHLEIMNFLIERGVNIEDIDDNGKTYLIQASCCGKIRVVKFLIEKGADISHKDHFGNTFDFYLQEDNKKKVDLFLKDIEERKRMIKHAHPN